MPSSYVNSALLKGGKNRIINGAFLVNQRAYASGTALASGSYGLDRWKSGYSNTTLTFTAGAQATTVTISTSGVLQQIIERANVVAGTYVLSWSGTATGRVYNSGGTAPSYAASPVTVTLDGSANVVVEFTASGSTKTLGTVQLERGTVASPFEYRHIADEFDLCLRYFQAYAQPRLRGAVGAGSFQRLGMTIPRMRTTPTCSTNGGSQGWYDGNSAVIANWGITVDYQCGPDSVEFDAGGSGWASGNPAILYFQAGGTCVLSLNAEL
jgi:hypothetical protein